MFQLSKPNHPAGTRRFWGKLALLLLCALAGQAQAQNTGIDTGHADRCMRNTGHPSYIYYQVWPATHIMVGQNAQSGDLIGQWITTTMRSAWRCKRRSNYSGVPAQVSVESKIVYVHAGDDTSLLGLFVTHDGETYRTSRLGDDVLSKDSLGYIARWRASIDGTTTDWTPLTAFQGLYQPGPAVTVTKNTDEEYDILLETEVHLMKRLNPPQSPPWNGNYLQGLVDPTYSWVYQETGDGKFSYGSGQYIIPQMATGTVTFGSQDNETCKVFTEPNIVKLPTVVAGDFPGPGSILGTTPFNLVLSCPAGYHSIGYYFTPGTPILDEAQGVIAVDSGGATGVGLQLTEGTGTVLKFGSGNVYPLVGYDPTILGIYPIPYNVSYYRTGSAPVTAGSVTATMTVGLVFQ